MSNGETLKDFVKEQRTAVKSETTIAEYEEELCQKNQRKQALLDSAAQTSPLSSPLSSPGPGLNKAIQMTSQIKDEPEEQMIKQEEEHLQVSIPESSAVCVKTEESSLLQQTEHKEEEKQGEDASIETHLDSESESDTDHSSYTDNDEDWRAPLSCADDGDHNQVQIRTRRTTTKNPSLSSKYKSKPKTSAAVNTGDMSGTAEGKVQQCPVCKKTLKGPKQNLRQHMIIHTGERPYSCSICQKAFALKNHLNTHMRTHTGERPFSCSICKKQFSRSNGPKNHMRVHTGEKPFSCSICNKTFAFQSNYLRHLRQHTGEKPRVKKRSPGTAAENNGDVSGTAKGAKGKTVQCLVCKKKLKGNKHKLLQHMRIHTGERPYSCSICHKSFPLKNHLDVHMRTHTGERPFSCSTCNKTFSQKTHLNTHRRMHTGEKPFCCSFCNKTFNTKANLQKHLKQHTKAL